MLKWIWTRRPAARTPGRRLGLELLEDRAVPSAAAGPAATTVYSETNDPSGNAVLAFRSNPANGSLTQIGSYPTTGTGELNLPKAVGPDDGDLQVVASRDHQFLFAVNEGSNSVTSFRIERDGGLEYVGTVYSGGLQPDSIGVADNEVFVVNRGDASSSNPGSAAPNVTGFQISPTGKLSAVPNATVSFPVGAYATQALVTGNDKLLFVNVAALGAAAEGNTVEPFQITATGGLKAAPGGGEGSTTPKLQLGLAFNPDHNIIYAGLTGDGQVGVYTYDNAGSLTFLNGSSDQGTAPCWCTVSADGRFLYVGNTISDSVGVYSLADPLHPKEIQEFALADAGRDATGTPSSGAFQIALDPTGKTLYAVSQNLSPDGSNALGNELHVLTVAPDGKLSEQVPPVYYATDGVPGTAHPQGLAVVAGVGPKKHDDDFGLGGD
jgi:6-phosphogluconolactonase (cycloisomerase 2 family)